LNLLIRKATKADLDEVIALENALFQQSYSKDYQETFFDQQSLLLAYDLNQLIGVCGYFNQYDSAEIIMIGVKQEYRKKHVATMLLKACLSTLITQNVRSLFIEVRESNVAAIKLYQSLNFIENRIRKEYYRNPVEDAIEMRLDL